MNGIIRSVFGAGRSGHDVVLSSDRIVFWLGALGLALTGLIVVWFGPQSSQRLEHQVQQAAQSALATGGHTWAQATAHGQRVNLSGAAPSDAEMAAAVSSVQTALGEGGVIHGAVTKVTATKADVVPVMAPYRWSAVRDGRQVALEGAAPTRAAQVDIEIAARRIFGSPNVTSRMKLASGVPADVDWTASAIAGLNALQLLDQGSAELTDDTMVVTGTTDNEQTAETVRDQLGAVETGTTISAFVSGPAEWTARLTNGALRFSGLANSVEDRQALSEIATDFFSAEFTDDSTIGTTGGWRQRMTVALPHFARFQSGQIDVFPGSIRISGNAAGSVLSFLREDMDKINDGYEVTYHVREMTPEIAEVAGVNLDSTDEVEREASCQTAFEQIMASNKILFDTGLASISRESGETLDKLIAITRRCSGLQIEIEGHTDATGRAPENRELSRARAEAVRAYFLSRNIEPERLTAVGYGEEDPVATNRTVEGRAQNRRIEFTVSSTEQTQ